MDAQIGWGILATGGIARSFTRDLIEDGHVVAAVGSRSQEKADRFAAEFSIPAAYGDYEALLGDPRVDIVYIATPHAFHAENALAALRAGKHILVEKPFTLNAAQAAEVVATASSTGLLALEGMWTRFLPHMVRIRELLESGAIGDVSALIADHTQRVPTNPEHRMNDPFLGGGALLDLGIYPISFASELFGVPDRIRAGATRSPTGVDARVATILEYPGGRFASLYAALDAKGPNTATILGSRGRIEIDPVWYSPTTFRVHGEDGEVQESYENTVEGRGMQFEAREAERLIRSGALASPLMPPEESVSIMRVLDGIRSEIGLTYPGE